MLTTAHEYLMSSLIGPEWPLVSTRPSITGSFNIHCYCGFLCKVVSLFSSLHSPSPSLYQIIFPIVREVRLWRREKYSCYAVINDGGDDALSGNSHSINSD